MRDRRPSIRHYFADRIQAIQEERLFGILRGEIKPDCARERLFAKRSRGARHIRLGDWILPAALFLSERRIYGHGPDGAF